MTKTNAILNRFLKGAIGSAIATILAGLIGITTFNNFDDVHKFLIGLVVPLLTGILLAAQKAYDWQEPENPIEIENTPQAKSANNE